MWILYSDHKNNSDVFGNPFLDNNYHTDESISTDKNSISSNIVDYSILNVMVG